MSRRKGRKACPDLSGLSGHGREPPEPADGLTAAQAKALEALVNEPSLSRAAAAAGVNERTLRRWLQLAAFRDALLRARRDAFGQAIGLTQKYAVAAVATLGKVMSDNATPPSSRVSAAGLILKFGREGVELDDLAERVEALERAAKGEGGREVVARQRASAPQEDEE
jgi:hypothetical protein